MPSRSAAKLENLAALEMPFELKALEVCLDSVSVFMVGVFWRWVHASVWLVGASRDPSHASCTCW